MDSFTTEDLYILSQHGILLSIYDSGDQIGVSNIFFGFASLENFLSRTYAHRMLPPVVPRILPSTKSSATALRFLGFEPRIAQQLSAEFKHEIETFTLPEYLKLFIAGLDPGEQLQGFETLQLMGAGADVVEHFQTHIGVRGRDSTGNCAHRWFGRVITERYEILEKALRKCKEAATALHEMYRKAGCFRDSRVDATAAPDSKDLMDDPEAMELLANEYEELRKQTMADEGEKRTMREDAERRKREETVDSAIDLNDYTNQQQLHQTPAMAPTAPPLQPRRAGSGSPNWGRLDEWSGTVNDCRG